VSAHVERDPATPGDPSTPAPSGAEPAPDAPSKVRMLLHDAGIALDDGRCVEGVDLSRAAVGLAVTTGDRASEAAGLAMLARQLTRLGDHELTAATCDQAAAVYRDLDDPAGLCDTLVVQALALDALGLSEEALDALEVAREAAGRLGDPTSLYWVHNRIAVVHSGLHEFERSHDYQMQALELSTGLDDDARFCILNNVADNAIGLFGQRAQAGDDAGAADAVGEGLRRGAEALEIATTTANPYRQCLILDNLGMLLGLAGDYPAAWRHLDDAAAIARKHGYQSMILQTAYHAARVLALQEQWADAVPALEKALTDAETMNELPLRIDALLQLSAVHERLGEFEPALRRYKEHVALERRMRSATAATRVRVLGHLADLENARLQVAAARHESLLHRARSEELEQEKMVLERQAHSDALTGVGNRHYLEVELARLYQQSAERDEPLAVAILDIDHFKAVNDTYGHAVGDLTLVRVAQLVAANLRTGDLIGRLGGEEFVLAFPGRTEAAAVRMAQRLRRAVQDFAWGEIRPGMAVTISIGVAARDAEPDVNRLLEHADDAMYRAKRAGRNRVERYAPLSSAVPPQR
jgi:diguanylate cyclase (GGDEF)-like protein